jgi:uncharacterized protein
MNQTSVIKQTRQYVEEKMSGEGTGHDWFHVERVWKLSLKIAESEKDVDLFALQLIALLHDIADWKFHEDTNNSIERAWLQKMELAPDLIEVLCQGIRSISFKGGANIVKPPSIEAKIVQDADRLDALGAIGIGRSFAYGGFKQREMYNPKEKPKTFKTLEEYKNNKGTTVNHFYEKLFLIRTLMHTKTAKEIAKDREKFMKDFLNEFYAEWNGNK